MSSISTSDLHRIFDKLDKNGDGLVSLDELKWLLERLRFHTTVDELESLAGRTSLDYIDFLFFYDIIIKGNNGDQSRISEEEDNTLEIKDLEKAFGVFDLNGDGFISSEELQSALSKLGLWDEQSYSARDCKNMIGLYDTNSDGKLDFEEFKNMMLLTKS